MTDRLARFIWRRRRGLSIAILLGAVLLLPYADIRRLDNDITAWFSRDDPVYQTYERFRNEFGGTRSLIIAIEWDRLFTAEGLESIRQLSEDIQWIEAVERVYSISTANIVQSLPPSADGTDDGGIEVRPLIGRAGDLEPDRVRRRALEDPLLRGDLVSDDGQVTAVVVTFDESRIDPLRASVLAEIRRTTAARVPDDASVHYNGSLEISETYNRVTLMNQRVFTPPILVCTLLGIYLMFRSIRRTALVLVAVLTSVVWTIGLYNLVGFTFNVLSSLILPLVAVLAIADDVHILQHFDEELRRSGDRERAFTSAIRHLFAPLLGASATTALGMLSLATSEISAVRQFGIGAAVGVMVDFVISIVVVPTLLAWSGPAPHAPPQETLFIGPLRGAARFAAMRPRLVLFAGTLAMIAAAFGVARLRVDTNHINFFAKDHPLSRSAAVIDQKLSGVYSFQIMLEGPPDSMKRPDVLARMETLEDQLERLENVRKVTSVVDYLKRINRELQGGDPAAERLPDGADAVAQELFVFSLSDQGRDELQQLVSSDYSRAQMTVKLAASSSDLVFEQVDTAERLARQLFAGADVIATATGSGRLFSTLDHYLVTSQISSFAVAFVTVFVVIFLVFRSFRLGLLAIAPNIAPVVGVLGLMGWLDISLNIATVMLASVALGIVDDDTVHFISRYRVEAARGRSTLESINLAAAHEARASLTTACINTASFGVLMLSPYLPTAWFGGMLAATMAFAFLAEIFLLPALIMTFPRLFAARTFARLSPAA